MVTATADATPEADFHPSLQALQELREDQNAPLRALYIMVCLEVGGFAMCIPVMSFFAIKELGMSPSQLGLVISCNAGSQLIGAWACGRLSDSWGRRALLLGAFAWSCACISGTVFVYNFTHLLLLRTLQGLSGGTTNLCHAYILDWVSDKKSGPAAYMALFGSMTGIAFLCGNVIGVGLVILGLERRTIFLVAGFFCFLATVYGCFVIQESLMPEKRRPLWTPRMSPDEPNSVHSASDLDAIGAGLVSVWSVRFLAALATTVMFSTYAFLINDMFGWTDMHFGAIMATSGLIYALLLFIVFPLFGQHGKLGAAAALASASCCGSIAALMMPVGTVILHLSGLLFFILSGALFNPAIPVLVGLFAGSRHLGFGNGISAACEKAAGIVGPFIGGVLYERSVWLMFSFGILCYICCAAGSGGIALAHEVVEESNEKKPIVQGDKA